MSEGHRELHGRIGRGAQRVLRMPPSVSHETSFNALDTDYTEVTHGLAGAVRAIEKSFDTEPTETTDHSRRQLALMVTERKGFVNSSSNKMSEASRVATIAATGSLGVLGVLGDLGGQRS